MLIKSNIKEDNFVKMSRLHNYQRFLIAVLLVAILIPVLAVAAYASDKYSYNYAFSTSGGTKYRYGTKTDSSHSGAVSVKDGSTFSGGKLYFQLQRKSGSDLSYESGPFNQIDNYFLYYYSDLDLSESIDVRLMFRATGAMSINGNFQP